MLKSFKSGVLLNIAISVCKYNKQVTLKDPRKQPVVVYFTQENDIKETLERIYTHITGGDLATADITGDQLLKLIDDTISRETGISLKIVYKPSKSVTTDYLYDLYDDLNAEGKECIFMIQDYLGRMRSTINYQEARFELGAIVDEISIFSKECRIPVLTAAQLNRGEVDKRELMEVNKRSDIANAMSGSSVGESLMISQNLDCAIIVAREKVLTINEETNNSEQHNYVGFKLAMSRFRERQVSEEEAKMDKFRMLKYFAIPIEEGGFRIAEDFDTNEVKAIPSISEKYGNGTSAETVEKITNVSNSNAVRQFMTKPNDNNSPMKSNNGRFAGYSKPNVIDEDDFSF